MPTFSTGMFRRERWLLVTDISRQHVGPIFTGHALFLDCLTREDGTHVVPKRR